METHQVLVSASPGDAITNAAFEIRALLRQKGPSEIYARYFDASLAGEVLPLDRYASRPGADPDTDVICFHASIGEPDLVTFLMARPERLVVLYHNISPSEPFREYDPRFADLLDLGREELRELAPRAHLALADSRYNASELEDVGFRDVRVSPLILEPDRLHAIEPHGPTVHHLTTQVEGPMAVFVGQLLPHKRPDLLLKAFHVLVTYLVPEARLVLVGAGRLPAYRQALQLFVNELNLPAALVGSVSDAELAAYYRHADVFVTASEHEGFCVPLVEAMSFDLPIVARAHAAVPETLGDAGVLLPPNDDPLLLAEALALVLTDDAVRKELVHRGRRRVQAFSPDRARATFLDNMAGLG
jgi:L-malate glycosyltransferase